MGNARMKLDLKGFDKMLENIKEAGADVDKAASRVIRESARIVDNELKTEAASKGVPSDITSAIKVETHKENDHYSAQVGWRMGNYDPKNPSPGYKAIFLNYGTVRRQTKSGENRGQIEKTTKDQQFIYTAKKKAKPKLKALQKKILDEVMGDLEK